ncbi:MAG: restriction endonuclease subunit S [Nostocales cyanobacterium ELA583]|jgi:type I restriction enzyme S subunit
MLSDHKKYWDTITLSELCLEPFTNGITLTQKSLGHGTKLVNIVDLYDNHIINVSNLGRADASEKQLKQSQLKKGDIIFVRSSVKREGAAMCAYFPGDSEPVVFGCFNIRFRPNSKLVDSKFITLFLRSPEGREQLINKCTTATITNINQESLGLVKVPLPPLPEQKRIAAILEKCDRLRRTRRYSLQLSETFLQSVFLEMFGDPVTNPMGWKRAKISDLGNVQTGNTPPRTDLDNYGNYIEWIKSDNIINDHFYVDKSEEMLSEKGAKIGRVVDSGSILVTCIAGSPTSIGNVALTNRKVTFNQQINSVTPNKNINSYFLYGLFQTCKPFIQRNTTLGMKRIITKSKFENLLLINPPLPLQEKFAQIVQKHDRFRTQQREAERQAEHLFQTLLHRAFRGELTSSDSNEVDISAKNHPQQPKTKSTDKLENLPIPATQPQTNALQLTLPGLE